MQPKHYFPMSPGWEVDAKRETFLSPPIDSENPSHIVLFDEDMVKDGAISASITGFEGAPCALGYEFNEASIMFRYQDSEHFYVAGMGGFAQQFFIAMANGPGPWKPLGLTGRAKDLEKNKPYDLRIQFVGSNMTLFHKGACLVTATDLDATYASGVCGLRTNQTRARFESVDLAALVKPRCFVIMPFAHAMDNIYRVIHETVEQYGLACSRADEQFASQPIIDHVRTAIASAELVIVDFTGRNPNVYFEAGLADAAQKKWIVLAQSQADLAIDVQHIRTIFYKDKIGHDEKLRHELSLALEHTLG